MMRKPSRRKLSTCSSVTTRVRYLPMTELSKQTLEGFLDSVAASTPAPGGGSSAAVAAALAAALVEMAARIGSAGGGAPSSAAEQASTLRARALRLAQEELTSYAPVLEARDEHERELALAAACEPPAQIAETAAEVAELGVEVAESASDGRAGRRAHGCAARRGRGVSGVPAGGDQRGRRAGARARTACRAARGGCPSVGHGAATATAARTDPALRTRVSGSAAPFRRCRSRRGPRPRGGSRRTRGGSRGGRGSGPARRRGRTAPAPPV